LLKQEKRMIDVLVVEPTYTIRPHFTP
jgi:hypothetical protein